MPQPEKKTLPPFLTAVGRLAAGREYLLLCFFALLGNSLWFQLMYRSAAPRRLLALTWFAMAMALSLGWSLVFTAVAAALPRWGKRVWLALLGVVFFLLPIVHGIYVNMFRKFFSFADLALAGEGFAFLDPSYLILRKLALLLGVAFLGMMIAAAVLAPKEEAPRFRLICSVAGAAVGLVLIVTVCLVSFRGSDDEEVIWDMGSDPAYVYATFSDTRTAMNITGLYHYTFRDLQLSLFPGTGTLSQAEREEIAAYEAGRDHPDNDFTGVLAGKNLILVQLEAIDTWMLDGYMPALKAVKEQSVSFSNHYTVVFSTGGTFNTEFMVNTGLISASAGTPISVYSHNDFPNSLPHLFAAQGYTANSFHGSEGQIYDRGSIHENLGYTYHSGTDMGMENYTMDSCLSVAFDQIAPEDGPFLSLVITYSGHGPYGESNPIYLAHAEEARAQAERTDGNYVYAVGHAMETDQFVAELMAYLEDRGLLENTAVVFYADHYNYYMMNDVLNMEIKGVDSLNLLQHTDWFIYSPDLEPMAVDKYTSSLDVLPTLANLFGLDADYGLLTGDDAFSDAGGYVFFTDGSWLGTDRDVSTEIAQRRHINSLLISGNYWHS